MGLAIDREQFDALEYQRFSGRLDDCLAALERMLERPGFGPGPSPSGPSWSCSWSTARAAPCR
jgi:hypothetical protein